MNQLSLTGHLTRDPQLRTLPDGRVVCDLCLAVNGSRDSQPLFIDIATFGAQAEACGAHLAKGVEIAFTGRLVYSEWQGPDGTKRSKHSAVGRVEFRGRPAASAAAAAAADAPTAATPARKRTRPSVHDGPAEHRADELARYLNALFSAAPPPAFVEMRYRFSAGMHRRHYRVDELATLAAEITPAATRTDVYVGALPRQRPGGTRRDVVHNASVL